MYVLLLIAMSALVSPVTAGAGEGVGSLDTDSLRQVLQNGRYSVIEFGGRRCVPCKAMQPTLKELRASFSGKLNVYNVYVDEQPDLARQYRIQLIPTQVIFDQKGKEVSRHIGLWEKADLNAACRKLGITR